MSNEIKIIIQFHEDDRKRLDALIAGKLLTGNVTAAAEMPAKSTQEAPKKAAPENPAPVQEKAQETPKTEPTQAEQPELPWNNEPAPAVTVTLAQIQQKVVQLCAAGGGTKKAKVRAIINEYASKVSELPADKLPEVWAKLTALEQEG